MNTVKKVLSRKSQSNDDQYSSDEGRLSSSTAPTSNPGSPQQHQKHFSSTSAGTGADGAVAGAGAAGLASHHHNKNTIVNSADDATRGTTGTAATTGSTTGATGTQSTGQKIANKIENGLGRSGDVHAQDGTIRHKSGHNLDASKHLDLNNGEVDQDVQHLGAVTHRIHQRHEVEEVTRQKEHHRHIHHIQHHTQPVLHSEHAAEQTHQKVHPVTRVHEKHASTDKDAALLTSVAGKHEDKYSEAPVHRQVVDRGEIVQEHIHHHIHNIVQPIIQHDSHEYHRIHTTIPTHFITHEAPIVHESTHHKAVSRDEFLAGGGSLSNSVKSIHHANLLNTGKCDTKVDGIAEQLERELGVKSTVGSKLLGSNKATTTNGTAAVH